MTKGGPARYAGISNDEARMTNVRDGGARVSNDQWGLENRKITNPETRLQLVIRASSFGFPSAATAADG